MKDIIFLTGFMTCGKSTVGPILANTLGWAFYDLDDVIEEKEGKSVVEIFKTEGEEYFRNLEKKTLLNFGTEKKIVIALGGGTISNEENFMIVKNSGVLIYLKASTNMIYNRIKNKIDRPLFRDLVLEERPKEEFLERIDKILNEREIYYNMADMVVDTDSCRIGMTVDVIVKKLKYELKIEF